MKRFALLLLLALLLPGCARTLITGAWDNPAGQTVAPLQSVAVFVVHDDAPLRQKVEDQLVAQLTKRGVKALPGYQLSASTKVLAQFNVREALAAAQVQHVLVVRKLGPQGTASRPRAVSETPKEYQDFYAYMQELPQGQNVQDYFGNYEHISIESNLYDVGQDQILLSIVSDTTRDGERSDLIENFCAEVLDFLQVKGYLQ